MDFQDHVLDSLNNLFSTMRATGEKAFAQLDFEQMNRSPGDDSNSIAIIIGHLRGNMLSRWTDFLTSDGEKPWRTRDSEFERPPATNKDELIALWNEGWQCCEETIHGLSADDLTRTITIRGQEHSVLEALNRQLYHYSYHVGQIVQLARMWKGDNWKTLSIARGQSKAYTPTGQHGEPPKR